MFLIKAMLHFMEDNFGQFQGFLEWKPFFLSPQILKAFLCNSYKSCQRLFPSLQALFLGAKEKYLYFSCSAY